MGAIEAAGEAVTGALLGRAIEPDAGEGHAGGHAGLCLNCGTALIGAHCHRCGQSGHVHRSLGAIGHEILHGVAHFEGKLWRTLPLLAWRPGELTRRYIAGERARFVSPMAIFLFSIFAMFAVFSIAGVGPPTDIRGVTGYPLAAIKAEREELLEDRARAVERSNDAQVDAADRASAAGEVAEADARLKDLDAAARLLKEDPIEAKAANTGWAALDHGVEKWQKNPSLMIYKLQSSVYKFSWLLIPLSVPFVWLMFCWRREYRLYDHTVFVTYSIAFMSLLFIVLTIASAVGVTGTTLALAATAVPLLHVTRQLRQAYRLRWRSAVLRALLLCVLIAVPILPLFLMLLLLLGILG